MRCPALLCGQSRTRLHSRRRWARRWFACSSEATILSDAPEPPDQSRGPPPASPSCPLCPAAQPPSHAPSARSRDPGGSAGGPHRPAGRLIPIDPTHFNKLRSVQVTVHRHRPFRAPLDATNAPTRSALCLFVERRTSDDERAPRVRPGPAARSSDARIPRWPRAARPVARATAGLPELPSPPRSTAPLAPSARSRDPGSTARVARSSPLVGSFQSTQLISMDSDPSRSQSTTIALFRAPLGATNAQSSLPAWFRSQHT